MLTSDLVLTRAYKGEIRPRYVDAGAAEYLALAAELIATFEAHAGHPRHQLDEALSALLGTGTAFLLHRGLAKLLRDRCDFETAAPVEPEALRATVFATAAEAYRLPSDPSDSRSDKSDQSDKSDSEPFQPRARHPYRFDHPAVLAAAAEELGIAAEDVERGLYADLKDEQVLSAFETCTPEWLLNRYNVALAQGVLYRASALTIRIAGQPVNAYRTLFRKIKFFQLLHRIEPLGGKGARAGGYEIRLDGPLSVFRASGRYGLQMATFLPTLLHFSGWSLEAELRWGKRRFRRTFRLSPEQGLKPLRRTLGGQYLPEELRWLPEQLEALDCGWTASAASELIDLGGEGVLVPDYVFEHAESGERVVMEVFGFWNRGALRQRLKLLHRYGPPNLILAVSKALAGKADDLDAVPAEVYVYRRTPLARSVRKLLRRWE